MQLTLAQAQLETFFVFDHTNTGMDDGRLVRPRLWSLDMNFMCTKPIDLMMSTIIWYGNLLNLESSTIKGMHLKQILLLIANNEMIKIGWQFRL